MYKIQTNFHNKSIKISKPSIPAVFIELMLKKIILEQFFELISLFSSVSCDCYITEVVCFQSNLINSSRPSEFIRNMKPYQTVRKSINGERSIIFNYKDIENIVQNNCSRMN